MIFGVSAKTNHSMFDSKTSKHLLKGEVLTENSLKEFKNDNLQSIKDRTINEPLTYCDKTRIVHLNMQDNCRVLSNKNESYYNEIDNWVNETELGIMKKNYPLMPMKLLENGNRENKYFVERKNRYHTPMIMLAKQHEEVSGWAYECKFYKVRALLKSTITNYHIPPRYVKELINPTPALCWNLVKQKVCINKVLECKENFCESKQPDLEKHYYWWSTQELDYSECSYDIRRIHSVNNKTEVFNKGCYPYQGECREKDSIIVWNPEEVVHDCSYEIISEALPFERIGNVLITNETRNWKLAFRN